MKVRKKPVEVDAVRFDGSPESAERLRLDIVPSPTYGNDNIFSIRTLEGLMEVKPDSWIITDAKGERYAIDGEIFEETYVGVCPQCNNTFSFIGTTTSQRIGDLWCCSQECVLKYMNRPTQGSIGGTPVTKRPPPQSSTRGTKGVNALKPQQYIRPVGQLIYELVHKANLPNNILADFPWQDDYLRDWVRRKNLYVCSTNDSRELAYEVARQLDASVIFTEPKNKAVMSHTGMAGIPTIKKECQQLKHFDIPEGATVLFVTDVIDTGENPNLREMSMALLDYHGGDENMIATKFSILPYILCLANLNAHEHLFLPGLGDCKARPVVLNLEIVSLPNMVVCDESNNTQDMIDNNELHVDIEMKPNTKVLQMIEEVICEACDKFVFDETFGDQLNGMFKGQPLDHHTEEVIRRTVIDQLVASGADIEKIAISIFSSKDTIHIEPLNLFTAVALTSYKIENNIHVEEGTYTMSNGTIITFTKKDGASIIPVTPLEHIEINFNVLSKEKDNA